VILRNSSSPDTISLKKGRGEKDVHKRGEKLRVDRFSGSRGLTSHGRVRDLLIGKKDEGGEKRGLFRSIHGGERKIVAMGHGDWSSEASKSSVMVPWTLTAKGSGGGKPAGNSSIILADRVEDPDVAVIGVVRKKTSSEIATGGQFLLELKWPQKNHAKSHSRRKDKRKAGEAVLLPSTEP